MKGIKSSQAVVALFVMILASTAVAATPYDVGFVWNRWADWKPGTSDGSSVGNPCKDAAGNPVWSAEYILNVPAGSDLDTSDGVAPWYTLPSSELMVWDSHWAGGSWAKLYDYPPNITRNVVGHIPSNESYHGNHYVNVPLVRWKNPSASPLTVSLTSGSDFQGRLDLGMPTGTVADLVIACTDASNSNSIRVLYSKTIVKTLAADLRDYVALDSLDIENLVLDPGDDILFSIRSRTIITGYTWANVALFDDVNITVVPEPATLSLLALGGLGMLRRRRRR